MKPTLTIITLALLGLPACFDTDSATDEAAPPVANPIAPMVGSVAAAPGLDRQEARAGGGGQGHAHPGLAESEIDLRVTNPSSGASIAVYLDLPATPPPHKAVVVVPGGLSDASGVFQRDKLRQAIAAEGVAVVRFDPEGRGNSGGQDDMYGEIHQAGLRAVIQAIIDRDDIVDDQVGVFSNSMGVIMATGAMKGGQTGARFLIDWEGPSSRHYTGSCLEGGGRGQSPTREPVDCTDDSYWLPREAERHIAELKVPYQRIQRVHDHVHDTEHGHAMDLYRIALEGGVPWVRMNNLEPGLSAAKVTKTQLPDIGYSTLYNWYPDYIMDLFAVVNSQALPVRQHTMNDGQGAAPGAHRQGGPPRGGGGGGKGSKQGRPGKR